MSLFEIVLGFVLTTMIGFCARFSDLFGRKIYSS